MRVRTLIARSVLVACLAVTCVWCVVDTTLAVPATARIKAAQEKAQAARERLDDLAADLEERTEEYAEAEDALRRTRAAISRTERELDVALADLNSAKSRLNGRVAAIYRSGGIDWLTVVLGASDFRDLVTRVDLMRRVGKSDADLVADVKAAKEAIEAARNSLQRRKAEQVIQRDQAREAQARMQAAVIEQKQYLEGLDATVKRLVAEEKARQEELARRRAAEAARLAAQAGIGRSGRPFDPSALGAPHPEVVDIARRFVGVTPYVWGGTTPSGFDCSGLVQYCYREVGVYLPRTSRQQFRVGAYISPDRLDLLEAGDLLFFGREGDPNRIHHVALYVGGGQMIHAPQTGELVSEASLLARIESRRDYVGAVRP